MKLDPKALAYTCAAIWGGCVLVVGLVNLSVPDYGREFLELLAGVYPGYKIDRTIGDLLVGTGYGLLDGAIGGWLFGWLYNRLAKRGKR